MSEIYHYVLNMNNEDKRMLCYVPQPNATADELAEVLKLVIFTQQPYKSKEGLFSIYDGLSENAKRHFTIKTEK